MSTPQDIYARSMHTVTEDGTFIRALADQPPSCPATEGHSCWDCAPSRRGKPRSTEGLSNGNPLTQPAREATTAAAQPKPFLEHWERVEIPKPSHTFDGAAPGTEGVVRITQPAKQAGKRTSKAASAKVSLRASIPVTFTF